MEGTPVAEVREWKRVKGKLWGLVRCGSPRSGSCAGEFPLVWREERDLGAFWVARGKAATRSSAKRRSVVDVAAAAVEKAKSVTALAGKRVAVGPRLRSANRHKGAYGRVMSMRRLACGVRWKGVGGR